jgi:hypothetical protein
MPRRTDREGAVMRHVVLAAALSLALTGPATADPLARQPLSAGPSAEGLPGEEPDDADIGFEGCGSHGSVTRWLSRRFSETPFARGLQGDGRLFELYMAKEGATWTVVVTDPAGESCIVTEGTALEVLPHGAGPVA